MNERLKRRIHESRVLFQNPYAYLAGGGYEALDPDAAIAVHDERRLLENQYAYLDENGGYGQWPGYKPVSEKPLIVIDRLLGRRQKGQAVLASDAM